MAWTTRWTIVEYSTEWFLNDKKITCTTNRTCHMRINITRSYPFNKDRNVFFRGVPQRHGLDIQFRIAQSFWQEEDGDTLTHTFWIRDWEYCDQRYWFFDAAVSGRLSRSQSCIFSQHFTGEVPPPGPVPTEYVWSWDILNRIIRCGNHYTFWANDTWYCMIPTPTSLTMWKLSEYGFIRQDIANEPGPVSGAIADADACLKTDVNDIVCAFFSNVASPGPHELYYVHFLLEFDSWHAPVLICNPVYSAFALYHVSMALDAAWVPHVTYTDYPSMFPELHYRNRIDGVWNPAEIAIKVAFKAIAYSSCWIDPANDAFHVTAVANTSEHWYNRRPASGPPWDGNTQMGTNVNLGHQSIMAGQEIPHVAGISTTWRVDHYEDQPPSSNQQDLSMPSSTYANMIAPADVGGALLIMFSNAANHLAYVLRPALLDWLPEVQMEPDDVLPLACNYHAPDVVSSLWQEAGASRVSFLSHWAPWHP